MKLNVAIYLIIALVVIILTGTTLYFLDQNQKLQENNSTTSVSITPAVSPIVTQNETIATPTTAIDESAVVIIESEGNLPKDDISTLKARVIEPYVEYYKTGSQKLATFKVSLNTQASKIDYPYMADAIFVGGGNEGFLISKKNGQIDWWVPGCIVECQFSDVFKQKYPEIVELSK